MDKIKIGWKTYDIEVTTPDKRLYVESQECYGTISYDDYKIYLSEKYDDQQKRATLLHEVLHGVGEMYRIKELESEDVVSRLADALMTVLVDNQLKIIKE